MNIAITKFAGMFVVSLLVTAFVVTSFSSAQSRDDLEKQLAELRAQLSQLQSSQATTQTSSSSRSAYSGCSTWNKNLVVGSRGEDVRQLQTFLNDDPATKVASSGAGSPGNETEYYGPATAAAVSKFQVKHAGDILTPLGLSRGTGAFYASTRAKANELCRGSGQSRDIPSDAKRVTSVRDAVDTVSGGLSVKAGRQARDGYAVRGANRVPYTTLNLSAGRNDVRVTGVKVRRVGLSSDDSFDGVMLIDQDGTRLGRERGLNSRSEATIGGSFFVPAGETVTVTVAGNLSENSQEFQSGAVAGFEVLEVYANSNVDGSFPIRSGAAHVNSDAITLQPVIVDWKAGSGTKVIELNEFEEVAQFALDLPGSVSVNSGKYTQLAGGSPQNVDEEDVYVKSLTLEQIGNFDNEDIDEVRFIVDRDENYTATRNGDYYTVLFSGKGFLIEEGDNVKVSVEVKADRTESGDKIQFKLDEASDLYVVGRTYQYSLPVLLENNDSSKDYAPSLEGSSYTVSAGTASRESRTSLDRDDFDVIPGDDVLLGAVEYDIKGETISFEEVEFEVVVSGLPSEWTNADSDDGSIDDIDELEIRNIALYVNGQRVARLDDDVEIKRAQTKGTVTVTGLTSNDTFDVSAGRDDVLFTLRGDLSSDWAHSDFNGVDIQFTATDADKIEGVDSEEDIRSEFLTYSSGNNSYTKGEYLKVEVQSNRVKFEVSKHNVDEDKFVSGASGVVFGTFEVDADDSNADVELDSLSLSLKVDTKTSTTNAKSEYIDNCIIEDNGERVADSRDPSGAESTGSAADYTQLTFNFDRNVSVRYGRTVEFKIVCDISDNASENQQYQFVYQSGDTVEYEIDGETYDRELDSAGDSETITIAGSGTLSSTLDKTLSETSYAVAVGGSGKDGIDVIEVELDADNEDITIKDIILTGVTLNNAAKSGDSTSADTELADVLEEISISLSGSGQRTARDSDNLGEGDDRGITLPSLLSTVIADTSDARGEKTIMIEDVNSLIRAGRRISFDIRFDLDEIDENTSNSGVSINVEKVIVVWEGEESNIVGYTSSDVGSGQYSRPVAFRAIPEVSASARTQDFGVVDGAKVYEFRVKASGDDVYLRKVTLGHTISSGLTLSNLTLKSGGETLATTATVSGNETVLEIATADSSVRINEGGSSSDEVFSVYVDIAGTTTDQSVSFFLKHDDVVSTTKASAAGTQYAATIGNFVWSPNSLNKDGVTTGNGDWFSGATVFDGDDIESWRTRDQ